MKIKRIFIVCFTIFLMLTVGCSNETKDEGNKIVVENKGDGTRREIILGSKYVQLDEEESAELFKILTGEKLSTQVLTSYPM